MNYHEGEIEVQTRAGVRTQGGRAENAIRDFMPPPAQKFLEEREFFILSFAERSGRVWASPLTGKPGFVQASDERTVHLRALPSKGDPLSDLLASAQKPVSVKAGGLAIDLSTRRRMRVNGTALFDENGLTLRVREAYSNCPKYIQKRTLQPEIEPRNTSPSPHRGAVLTPAQIAWIQSADTFFIASVHPEGGADASHRGGRPGFVHVENETTLLFPDYSGNAMFNTLGNLTVNPSAGLLFIDFKTGSTLQLTGMAEILWDAETAARLTGAERAVRFSLLEARELQNVILLRADTVEFSPFNPAG